MNKISGLFLCTLPCLPAGQPCGKIGEHQEVNAMTKVPDFQVRAAHKWDSANLDKLAVAVPKGTREKVKARAAEMGLSINKYVYSLIEKDLQEQ